VLSFLLAHPDDWDTRTGNLPDFSPTEGRDAIRTSIRELTALGYVEQFKEKYLDEESRKLLWRTVTVVKDDPDLTSPGPAEPFSDDELVSNNSEDASGNGSSVPLLLTPTSTTNSTSETTSLQLGPVAGAETPKRRQRTIHPIPTSRPRKETARDRALAAVASEDESDPFKVILAPEPVEAVLPAQNEDDGPATRPSRKRRSVGPSEALARMFGTVARQQGHDVPGMTNVGALAGSFAQWMRDGVEQDVIRTMIEGYWADTFQRRDHLPAWQDFLAQRGSLTVQGTKAAKSVEVEASRADPSRFAW